VLQQPVGKTCSAFHAVHTLHANDALIRDQSYERLMVLVIIVQRLHKLSPE